MARTIQAEVLAPGTARGEVLASREPLSFWGGYDASSGEIVDRRHPLSGRIASGKVLAVPFTKGSSTTTAVLLEAVRTGHAPAAVVCRGRDAFLALASIVADEMYGAGLPVVATSPEDFEKLRTGQRITIGEDGTLSVLDTSENDDLLVDEPPDDAP